MATSVRRVGTAKAAPVSVSEGAEIEYWQTRLGAGINDELVNALVKAGYGYIIQGGSATTPITGAGVYVNTTPDMDILVPSSKAFIPLYICVKYETVGTNGIQEVIATAGTGGTQGAATAVTPVNLNTAFGNESGLTARSPSTGATLMSAKTHDIWTSGVPVGVTKTTASATASVLDDSSRFEYNARSEGVYHILQASDSLNARLNIWMGGQAPTGFIIVKGLVVPVSFVN